MKPRSVTRVTQKTDPAIYKDAFAAGSELHPRDALALVRGDSPGDAANNELNT